MRALSGSDLLNLWERGYGMHAIDRALLALSMALPEASAALPDWVVGRRNQALIELHRSLFGPNLQAWAVCESCGEKMEFSIDANALLQQNMSAANSGQTVVVNGQSFRLPTSRDLADVAQQNNAQKGALCLMQRCITNASGPAEWSETEMEQVGEKMAMADPLAEIRLSLPCPTCGNETTETVEVTSFLWGEIEGCARRLLWEVHAIASAYGWTESEVLSLSPARRARYVEMAQA
ncbi:MAG TPA: hypothetical protein VHA06_19480 [Candidatus Angelobacter sp.]|nr:hypothetical protein [Candidatus Angelobacter sp.]